MAGNFWTSSHFKQWTFPPSDFLLERNDEDLKVLTEDEYAYVSVFYANLILQLGELLNLRQQVIATSIVYFKRFYYKYSFSSVDPLLMVPACLLLSSKVEEFGVLSTSRLVQSTIRIVKSSSLGALQQTFTYKPHEVLECEFLLLETMDCCLIVYQPYRPLTHLAKDLPKNLPPAGDLLGLSWRIVNDMMLTDVPLQYSPSDIAIGAIFLASIVLDVDLKQWFASLTVDIDKVRHISQLTLKGYKTLDNLDAAIKDILRKLAPPRRHSSKPIHA